MRAAKFRKLIGRDRRAGRGHSFADGVQSGVGPLPIRIDLIAHQILPRLPFLNQRELVTANQRFRG